MMGQQPGTLQARRIEARVESFPAEILLPLADLHEGDFLLRTVVSGEDEQLAEMEYRFSLAHDLEPRLLALHKAIAATDPADKSIDRPSGLALADLLGAWPLAPSSRPIFRRRDC